MRACPRKGRVRIVRDKPARRPVPQKFSGGTFAAAAAWLAEQKNLAPLLDVEMTFTGVTAKSSFSIHLHTGKDELTSIACDAARGRLAVDRTRSGRVDFHAKFPARHEAPLRIADGRCSVRLLLDTSSLEVFAQGGETVLAELIFPTAGPRNVSIAADGGAAPSVQSITIHALK